MPTYNEKENIASILEDIFNLPGLFDVLVVDDSSPDGTADIVMSMQARYVNRLFLEKRKQKDGLGKAYLHGFNWCLKNNYTYMIEMDADFSHSPKDIPRLLEPCIHGAMFTIGSRYVRGGRIVDWPFIRHFYSRLGSMYTRFFTRMPIKDTTAGFVCYHRKVLEKIDFNQISGMGYVFQIQMKYVAWRLGFTYKEIPITFLDRQKGTSKMNFQIAVEALKEVLKLKNYRFNKQ